MTYAWSGFRIACLGEKSPAQSVEQPDSHNAAVLYNDTEFFRVLLCHSGETQFQKEGMLIAYDVFIWVK